MPYVLLAAAALAPLVLIAKGKRLLGNQTHPAAVFILAWMLCGYLVGLAEASTISPAGIAFVWVGICFPVVGLWQKKRSQPVPPGNNPD